MDRKLVTYTGIRIEIPQGTGEPVAIDELIDDLLRGDVNGALHALHEPCAPPGRDELPPGRG